MHSDLQPPSEGLNVYVYDRYEGQMLAKLEDLAVQKLGIDPKEEAHQALMSDPRWRRALKHVTFYDLRATGLTWRTLRGDDARIIQRAAGHEKYATTEGYVREASIFRGRVGVPFPPLPGEFRSRVLHARCVSKRSDSEKVASPRGFETLMTGVAGESIRVAVVA